MRSLYISLSQRSSITIILIPKFRLLQLGIQMENYEDLSNIEHFSSPASFTNLLTIMGVDDNERSHLTSDGFTTLRDFVEHFERSSGSQIRKYFEKINSTFGSYPVNKRDYFSPRAIQQLLGTIWYYTYSVYTFHSIPSLTLITVKKATDLGIQLEEVTDPTGEVKIGSATDDDITLPKLKEGNTWIYFRDKIILKISRMQNR